MRQTDGGTEVHEGLIEIAGSCTGGIMRGQGLLDCSFGTDGCDILIGCQNTHDDTQNIAIDRRPGTAPTDGSNGAGGVAADAGQSKQACKILR